MKDYPARYQKLRQAMGQLGQEIPDTMGAFGALHKSSIQNGALTAKTKELIALGISIKVRCEGCIAFHVHDALQAEATKEEILETIGVAVLMGGGSSVMYGCDALEALQQFSAA